MTDARTSAWRNALGRASLLRPRVLTVRSGFAYTTPWITSRVFAWLGAWRFRIVSEREWSRLSAMTKEAYARGVHDGDFTNGIVERPEAIP